MKTLEAIRAELRAAHPDWTEKGVEVKAHRDFRKQRRQQRQRSPEREDSEAERLVDYWAGSGRNY